MTWTEFLSFLTAAFSAALGVAAVTRSRPTLVQWSFAAGMLLLGAESMLAGLSFQATPELLVTRQRWMHLIIAALPLPWVLFSLSYSRGGYQEKVGRWIVPLCIVGLVPIGIAAFGWEDLIVRRPDGGKSEGWMVRLGTTGSAVKLLLLLASIFVLMNVERTFRGSIGTARWRMKYMVLGVGCLFGARVYTASQELLFSGSGPGILLIKVSSLFIACLLMVIGFLRAGIRHIDVYPSRSVIQQSLTILLAGIYLFTVGILAKVVTAWGGAESLGLQGLVVMVALVGLSILLLSERLRDHAKRFVSRHFRRPNYDFAQVWSNFAQQTALTVDAASLSRTTTKWLSETFRALSVTIWVTDPVKGQLVFGASTSLSADQKPMALRVGDEDWTERMLRHGGPIDLEQCVESWVPMLTATQAAPFRDVGANICVPIFAQKELLGLILLSDRVNGVPFTVEELDLLKCIAAQLAGSLRSIQLSQRLLQAREMEAFQAMSAFFVHDLKNTASTLSLMLQNLPAHFDDPDFRADALRGLSKSVGRINELIGRLGLLRQELDLKLATAELNDLVSASLSQLPSLPSLRVEREVKPLPTVQVDPDKIQKVIANILLNAMEAMGGHGRIRVVVEPRSEWAAVTIADDGPGMAPEFLERSLFRPFQTTKKKGIGIGMFLSKAIVEAHGGRIEVVSEPGKGASFAVLLPMQKEKA